MIEEYNGGFLIDDMPCKQVQCCRNVTDRLRIYHTVFKPCIKTILSHPPRSCSMVRDHALLSPFSLDCMVIPASHLFSPVFTSVSHHSSFATVLRYGFFGSVTSVSPKDCLLARPAILHNLCEGFVIEAHYLINHRGYLGNIGFVGLQRLFDLDHTFLDRHIGVGVARLDEIFDAIPVIVEGLKGLPRLGEVAGL